MPELGAHTKEHLAPECRDCPERLWWPNCDQNYPCPFIDDPDPDSLIESEEEAQEEDDDA